MKGSFVAHTIGCKRNAISRADKKKITCRTSVETRLNKEDLANEQSKDYCGDALANSSQYRSIGVPSLAAVTFIMAKVMPKLIRNVIEMFAFLKNLLLRLAVIKIPERAHASLVSAKET